MSSKAKEQEETTDYRRQYRDVVQKRLGWGEKEFGHEQVKSKAGFTALYWLPSRHSHPLCPFPTTTLQTTVHQALSNGTRDHLCSPDQSQPSLPP